VAHGEAFAGFFEGARLEDPSVVREEASGLNPRRSKPGDGSIEETRGSLHVFGFEGFDVAQSRVIVDADIHVLPAGTFTTPGAVAVDSMSGAAHDAAQFLDVYVEQISGPLVLVAARRLGRLKRSKASHTVLPKNSAYCGLGQADRL